jgi:hypothetical protein
MCVRTGLTRAGITSGDYVRVSHSEEQRLGLTEVTARSKERAVHA